MGIPVLPRMTAGDSVPPSLQIPAIPSGLNEFLFSPSQHSLCRTPLA